MILIIIVHYLKIMYYKYKLIMMDPCVLTAGFHDITMIGHILFGQI